MLFRSVLSGQFIHTHTRARAHSHSSTHTHLHAHTLTLAPLAGGHSYDVPYGSLKDIVKVAEQERDFVANFAARCRAEIANIGVFDTGVGSTPTASHPPPHLDGISEMVSGATHTHNTHTSLAQDLEGDVDRAVANGTR